MTGCSVFRKTAVDQHVAASRDLTLQGLQSCHLQNCVEAEEYFRRAVQSDPENVEARLHLAEKFRERGAFDEAIQQLELSRKISPDNVQTTVQLGECYRESQQTARAYQLALTALRQDRESLDGWKLKARTLWKMGRRDDALADYHQALRIDPDDQTVRGEMATLYQELGKPLRALTTLDQIANDFHDTEIPDLILVQQAAALRQMNRTGEAITRLEIGFERNGFSEQLAESYVAALLETNQLEKASAAIQVAAGQHPQSQGISQLMARIPAIDRTRLAQNEGQYFK